LLLPGQLNTGKTRVRPNEPRLKHLHRHHAWRDENDGSRQESQGNASTDWKDV